MYKRFQSLLLSKGGFLKAGLTLPPCQTEMEILLRELTAQRSASGVLGRDTVTGGGVERPESVSIPAKVAGTGKRVAVGESARRTGGRKGKVNACD